jgi:hypothetical protein
MSTRDHEVQAIRIRSSSSSAFHASSPEEDSDEEEGKVNFELDGFNKFSEHHHHRPHHQQQPSSQPRRHHKHTLWQDNVDKQLQAMQDQMEAQTRLLAGLQKAIDRMLSNSGTIPD